VGFTQDGYTFSDKIELYNLASDLSETTDLSTVYPDIMKNLVNEAMKKAATIPKAPPILDEI
jgi:hypothetical protein